MSKKTEGKFVIATTYGNRFWSGTTFEVEPRHAKLYDDKAEAERDAADLTRGHAYYHPVDCHVVAADEPQPD